MSALNKTPLTPQGQKIYSPNVGTPTGTWRHPRLDEINHRVQKNTFNERNVHRIIWNSLSLLSTFAAPRILASTLPSLVALLAPISDYGRYAIIALRFLFAFNLVVAFLPLFRKPDDISDIPLTPSQRSLLGLPPTNAPPTPGSQYITPPRYARSSTPLSGSGSRPGSRSGSPLSGRGQPMLARRNSIGPDSPLSAAARSTAAQMTASNSPLFRKVTDGSRRQSADLGTTFTRSTILAMESSTFSSHGSIPGSPTPSGFGSGRGPSVALNSKWLYERGSSVSPGKRSLF